jgi:CheY-like chemotaxis protein
VSILIVDDQSQIRGFARQILERAGYTVREAANGRQAMDEALSAHIDLVVTDICMPDMDGIELIRKLKSSYPQMGIIAISGAFQGRFLKVADLLGVKAVLQKPFTSDALLDAVRSAAPATSSGEQTL